MTTKPQKIFWNVEEKKLLIHKVHSICTNRKIDLSLNEKGVLRSLIDEAQEEVLLSGRQRDISTSNVDWVREGVLELATSPKPVQEDIVLPPGVEAEKIAELENLIAESLSKMFFRSEAGKNLVKRLQDKLYAQAVVLATAELEKAVESMPDRPKAVVETEHAAQTKGSVVTEAPERKPRVVCVGLKSDQLQDLEKNLPHLYIRNIEVEGRKNPSFKSCKKANLVVAVTKFVSHAAYKSAKVESEGYGAEFLHHANGMTSLKEILLKKFPMKPVAVQEAS